MTRLTSQWCRVLLLCSTFCTHLVDHTQRALKHSIKDLGDFACDVHSQLVYDGCHGAENLRFPGSWDVSLVVDQHGLQQGGDKVLPHLGPENMSKQHIKEDCRIKS